MIKTKEDLKEYIKCDDWYYNQQFTKWDKKLFVFLRDPQYLLHKYKIFLRKEEYYLNNNNCSKMNTLKRLYYIRRKNRIGNKLGICIPPNTFGKGLVIMHHGSIIVNPNVRVGEYCILHGNNCLGNNGKSQPAPCCGNRLDVGIGASLIGNIKIGNNVTVGANAIVNKSFDDNCVLVGVPAKSCKPLKSNS